jgi:hypothetical protein
MTREGIPPGLIREFTHAAEIYTSLTGARKALREYNLGKIAGILETLDVLGHEEWRRELLARVGERESEGDKLWHAIERWMGQAP